MNSNRLTYLKNILMPCFMSVICGIFVGGLIFLFKFIASNVISMSAEIYSFVRSNLTYIPILIIGMAIIGLVAAIILKYFPDCRGGGIPTSIALLRGLVPFSWIKSVVFVFFSSMLTYFCGVPLGNEGPSVQMGTSIGKGTVRVLAKKDEAWERYVMTGGACAGFAAATGSPVTGIFFALEEAHRRLSPMIFMVASVTVISGVTTSKLLCDLTHTQFALFEFEMNAVLPMQYIWSTIIVGIIVGFTAAGFTKAYRKIRHFVKKTLVKVPFMIKIVAIFVLTAFIGILSANSIGSGHDLIDELLEGPGVWYLLVLVFCVRAILLLAANNSDVTGGLFVPTLAFGAIIGSVCGQAMTAIGILPDEFYPLMVVTGIASFLGAASRTPIMAITFSMEALCGLTNILPITFGVTIAYLVIVALNITDFTDTVIESKVEAASEGKCAHIIDTQLKVSEGSFVVGKEIRDLLLPPTCVIISIKKTPGSAYGSAAISVGDVLHVRYRTYTPEETMHQLEAMVGVQTEVMPTHDYTAGENETMPEI